MARILRRRVVKPTRAPDKRVSPQEINQWLQLGLTAAQIGEKLIPDDPKTSPEAYSEVLKARFQGPGQDDDYDVFVKEQIQPPPQAGGPSQPAAPPPQPDAEGAASTEPEPLQAEKDQVKRTVAGAATARQGNFERVMSNFNRGLAIVHENSHPWNRGEKIDLYIAAFEKNLGKSPLMNSGSAKSRRDAVDIYVANKRAQTAEARVTEAGAAREARVAVAGEDRASREKLSANRIAAQEAQTEARAALQEARIEAGLALEEAKQANRFAIIDAKGKSSRGLKRFAAKLRAKENRIRQGERVALAGLNNDYRKENKLLTVWFNAVGKKREQTPGEKQLHKRSLGQAKNLKEVMAQHNSLEQLKLVPEYQEALLMVQAGTPPEDLGDEYREALRAVENQEASTRNARAFFSSIQDEIDGLAEDAGYTIKTRLVLPVSYLDDIAPPPEAAPPAAPPATPAPAADADADDVGAVLEDMKKELNPGAP